MQADDLPMPIQQHSIYLQSWNVQLTVVLYKGRQWFIVRQVCTLLGVQTEAQVANLTDRELMSGLIEKIPVATNKGIRDAWCIDIDAISGWMFMISDRRVRSEVRPNLLKLQRDIMSAARRVMFGEVDTYATKEEVRDLQHFTWFLESLIIADQQQKFLMPESDAENE